ncbi:MAG: cell division protein ZapA [Treponema sp.]|nr:cell division protein ZapA [Candidatus Treponema merdequi]
MAILHINVLGSSFAISAKEDEQYLNKLLAYYKQIVEHIQKSDNLKDQKQTAILAGVLLCDELYKEKAKNFKLKKQGSAQNESNDDEDINQITSDLISKIEQVLE